MKLAPYRVGRHFSDSEGQASSIDKYRLSSWAMCLDKAIEALLVSLSLTLHCNRPGRAITLESDVQEFLESRFFADAAGELATDVEFRFPDHSVFCDIRNRSLSFPDISSADLVLYFESPQQAKGLLSGSLDPITAFMESRLRANGHLIRVFQLFAAFSRGDANSV